MPTKEILREALKRGECLENILNLKEGQDCTIFKTDVFFPTDIVVYIPDMELNAIPYEQSNLSQNAIDHIMECCYSGKDFVELVGGDETKAKRLFQYVDWQHPSSAYYAGEIDDDDEEEEDENKEEISNNIGIVFTVSQCSYTGTPVSWPVAIVTDLSKTEEIKKSIINKYGDCETYYFHINTLEPVTEEEVKNLEDLKEMRGEFNVEH